MTPSTLEVEAAQDSPTSAPSPRRLPLGIRLALFVALSVAGVIAALTGVGIMVARGRMVDDLRETARVAAVAVADDIELRQDPWSAEGLSPLLRDFMNAGADLRWISVFRKEQQRTVPVASTSIVAVTPPALVNDTIASGEPAWSDAVPHVALVAVPVQHDDVVTGAVAVAVSLASVEQVQRTTALIAGMAALVGAGAITLLIHLLARRLILEPLAEIRRVMARVQIGDASARARVTSSDEMREVADGLNAMLADLDGLHGELRDRVAAATGELRVRNEQLARSYESVLQLRETAARAQQLAAVGQTLANVAHQIGTPLNLISGHVQLLRRELTDPAMQRRLQIVAEQAERMAAAVRDLLQRARPDADRRPVRIGDVLATIGDAMRGRLAASGVMLQLEIDDAACDVSANRPQLEMALLNLVTNALDAMRDGGTLKMTVAGMDQGVRVVIQDSGGGIPDDVLPRIFEPWVTTKAAGGGSGLGLSITRDVVSGMGGTMAVATSSAGTTFTIDLPASDVAAPQ